MIHPDRKRGKNSQISYNAASLAYCLIALTLFVAAALWAQDGEGRRVVGFVDVLLLPRIWVGAIFCVAGLVLLMKSRVRSRLRLIFLVVIFFAFGAFFLLPLGAFAQGMGLHPSPVCAITKPFLFINAGRGVPVIFTTVLAFMAVFSIVANKLFCGWACPIGAIQEIFHRIKTSKKLKIKLPFRVTNIIRALVFVIFIGVVFTAGFSLYDYISPFHFLHWNFDFLVVAVMAITLIAAIFIFRPFCYLVCPIGLFTWVIEHVSLVRIRLNKEKCNECNVCVDKSPCPAVPAILEEKRSRPDCHACGFCQEICPTDAFEFR